MSTFVGADFRVQSAAQLGLSGIRVRFTHDPLTSDSSSDTDALHVANYTVTGPILNNVVSVAVVPDDPQAVDLGLEAPLVIGAWQVDVSPTIMTATSRVLQTPYTAAFNVSFLPSGEAVSAGAVNDTAEGLIRKHLPSSLRGRAWDALIAALATGDRLNWENARLAFDQLFRSTASGVYLDRRASDVGFSRPANIGMSDELFRQLTIKTTSSKLTMESVLDTLEVFYGSDSVRASITTELAEPFALADGEEVTFLLDKRDTVNIVLESGGFSLISQARAEEVAVALTRGFRRVGNKAFAVAVEDPATNSVKVRVYSGSLGLGSSVAVIGGSAQLGLEFPDKLTTYSGTVEVADAYNWTVTTPEPGTNRISLTATSPKIDLSVVRAGDYMIFSAENSTLAAGIYTILDVGVYYSGADLVQYVDISASAEDHVFLQLGNADMVFFRPTSSTIYEGERPVVVAQTTDGELDVVIPTTTQAVGRTVGTGSYLSVPSSLDISSLVRKPSGEVLITTSSAHGLAINQHVTLEDLETDLTLPSISAGNGTTTTDASPVSLWSALTDWPINPVSGVKPVLLNDGSAFLVGGYDSNVAQDEACTFGIAGSVELADGSTRYTYAWTACTPIPVATAEYGISMLTDATYNGRPLVTGGCQSHGITTSSFGYIYNPSLDSWATIATVEKRAGHAQVTLDDGRALLIGGFPDTQIPWDLCEVFTPWTGLFSSNGTMTEGRYGMPAVKLLDGRVLVIGGYTSWGANQTAHCEIFDPDTDTWSPTGSMTWARSGHRAQLLSDGRVFVVGGYGFNPTRPVAEYALVNAEIYDPNTGCWSPAGKMQSRTSTEIVQLADGKILVVGGDTASQYYDPSTGAWSFTPRSLAGFSGQSLITLPSGPVLHAAGDVLGAATQTGKLYIQESDGVGQVGLTGTHRIVTAPWPDVFTIQTSQHLYAAGTEGTVTPVAAVARTDTLGPFVFDPDGGLAITAIETEVTQDLVAGKQYSSITVADSSEFPDEPGWLVISFGYDSAVYPVKYLGKLSDTAILIDYSLRMPTSNLASGYSISLASRVSDITTLTLNLPAGISAHDIIIGQSIYFKSSDSSFSSGYKAVTAISDTTISFEDVDVDSSAANPGSVITSGPKVTLLLNRGSFTPEVPEEVGAFYVTASNAGQAAALASLESVVAAGITINTRVVYPGDRGLGGEGLPSTGAKVSDKVAVWGGDDLTTELAEARGEE